MIAAICHILFLYYLYSKNKGKIKLKREKIFCFHFKWQKKGIAIHQPERFEMQKRG